MLHVLRLAGFAWILGGSCLVISGCGSGSDDGCTGDGCDPPSMTNAYHEHQFREDPDLRAGDESTVILQLEASDPHENDSALEGVDIIPYRYEQSGEHQFCFAPDRDGRPHEFSVRQVGGTELLRIRPGECDSRWTAGIIS